MEVSGFTITGETLLRNTGIHHDIPYSVSNHGREREYREGRGTYCYYVYISEVMLSAEEFSEFWLPPAEPSGIYTPKVFRPCYRYDEARWSQAQWHCGVTWYSKEAVFDGAPRVVKIGCDYSHLWDEDIDYTIEAVTADAIATIDCLREM